MDQYEKNCDSLTAKNEASKKEIAGLTKNIENLKVNDFFILKVFNEKSIFF